MNAKIAKLEDELRVATDETETRGDGKVVRKDRWEAGIRRIAGILVGARVEFEIDDIVERVRALAETDTSTEGLTP
ncbi:MAG: hypothetical protein K0S65_977 [Labilithrix sp.]|nr:hypothetical protein [Labilithrix sp.]